MTRPPVGQSFRFEGDLNGASFAEFAGHRAARLDLTLEIEAASDRSVQLSVEGDPDLVDMFEMAMSLGPQDCVVHDITRFKGGAG